uniref:Uncharacterized protein n=1 Tax=Cucumis melo TaxID=3656 RepID=A0A9I9CV96_CUCME
MRWQKSRMRRERLRRCRNGHQQERHGKGIVRDAPNALTSRRRQRVTVTSVSRHGRHVDIR